MKEVVLRIEDSAFEKFMGMVSLCPQLEVLSESIESYKVGREHTFVPCELKFFDQSQFGSEEMQPKLIAMLKDVAVKIDVNSGRDWFTVYAGYRYYQKQLGLRGDYTDFFTDIEHLLPGVLSKIDSTKDRTERYQKYTVVLGREVDCWYMKENCLSPINELTLWKSRFTGDANRFEKNAQIIIEIYKRLRQI